MAESHRRQFDGWLELSLFTVAATFLTATLGWADEKPLAPSSKPKHHQSGHDEVPEPDPKAVQVPQGYRVEIAVKDLSFPTSVELDDKGNLLVAEAGPVPGQAANSPRDRRWPARDSHGTGIGSPRQRSALASGQTLCLPPRENLGAGREWNVVGSRDGVICGKTI